MDTISPVHADALRLLLLDLYHHLCEAEDSASKTGRWSGEDIDSVRGLIPDLPADLVLRLGTGRRLETAVALGWRGGYRQSAHRDERDQEDPHDG